MNRHNIQVLRSAKQIAEKEKLEPWGLSTSIDLKDCDPFIIRSRDKLNQFIIELCELIKMKRYGEPQIVNFGEGRVEGYSLVQLIETSAITGHFANESNAAFIDIFSCKLFEPKQASEFCKKFFKAKNVILNSTLRY